MQDSSPRPDGAAARALAVDFRSKPRSLWGDAARRFSRNLLAMISLCFVIVLFLVAIFANVLAPEGYDYQQYDQTWLFPSLEHPMGTDPFGRDVLTRIIYGARISLAVGFISNFVALAIGLPYGAAAAWYGGAVDYVLIRIIEIINSVPNLLLGILIITVLGTGFRNVLIVFAVTGWMGIARLVRGQFLSLREQDYVLAATCVGVPERRIIMRHLLPNSLSPIIVSVTLGIPGAILGEAGLSFLGIGINPPLPSWGRMLNDYLSAVQSHWYLAFFPGLMIALTMYAFTLMGDGLQEALDPTK